jgi:guanylate kinase
VIEASSPAATVARRGLVLILSSPSGAGKTTLTRTVVQREHAELSISVTTRPRRPSEIDGVHYRFVSVDEFTALRDRGDLLEWAEVHGSSYGTPRRPVEEALATGRPALLEIDLQGARQVRTSWPGARFVFLAPPSWDELVRRLVGRDTEPPEVIERRLEAARVELAAEKEFDVTLVNTSVQDVCRELLALMAVPTTD